MPTPLKEAVFEHWRFQGRQRWREEIGPGNLPPRVNSPRGKINKLNCRRIGKLTSKETGPMD